MLPRQHSHPAQHLLHLSTASKKDPPWPTVPNRIIEDTPLLAQVSKLMENAEPVTALRQSRLRARVIARMARKKSMERQQEVAGKKRGRRCGTANSELEQAYLPAMFGNIGEAGHRSAQSPKSRGERKRYGPAWDDRVHVEKRNYVGRLDRRMGVRRSNSSTRQGGSGEFPRRLKCGNAGTKSAPAITPPHQDTHSMGTDASLASRGGVGDGRGLNCSPSGRTAGNALPHKVCRHDMHCVRGAGGGGGRGGGGGDCSRNHPATSQPSTSSPTDDDIDRLPFRGVGYITYPATPDLTAVMGPSSSSASTAPHPGGGLEGPLAAAASVAVTDGQRSSRLLARAQRSDLRREGGGGERGGGEGDGGRRKGAKGDEGGAGGEGEGKREGEQPRHSLDGREAYTSLKHPDDEDEAGESRVAAESPAIRGDPGTQQGKQAGQGDQAPAEIGATRRTIEPEGKSPQRRSQQTPTADCSCSGVDDVDAERVYDSAAVVAVDAEAPQAATTAAAKGRLRRRAPGMKRERLRRGTKRGKNILLVMAKEGHPLVASKAVPPLPGVDEHQRPPFLLADMHEDLRQNRAALSTPFRHMAMRFQRHAPTPEVEPNAFDDDEYDDRARMGSDIETELTMVVRYFMSFGATGGQNGLTLQDLEAAFRASRRADAFLAIEKKGKEAFTKCLAMLEAHGLSPEAWLEELLSKRKGDSLTLTTFDMGESIRAYNRAKPAWVRSHKHWLHSFMITEKDLRWCQRFVDPDGNTDVDAGELTNAVRCVLDGKPRLSWEESRAISLILEFEKFMSANHIRLVDLFEKVDKDKGGTIDGDELRQFLKLGNATANRRNATRTNERRARVEQVQQERKRADLVRKAAEAKRRHARSRETGLHSFLSSLRHCTKTTGLRISDMIQATGAHPDEGMDPSQLLTFFKGATNSSLRLTKESLEKIVHNLDEDGNGLLSLSEIQQALTQDTQDELLLRRLAKAVAQHVARAGKTSVADKDLKAASHLPRREKNTACRSAATFSSISAAPTGDSSGKSGGRGTQNDGRTTTTRSGGGNVAERRRFATTGGSESGCSDGLLLQAQEGVGSSSLASSTGLTTLGRKSRWDRTCGGGDDADSEITMPNGCQPYGTVGSSAAEAAAAAKDRCQRVGATDRPRSSAVHDGNELLPGSEASKDAGLTGASTNAEENFHWILDDESSLDGIASMVGIDLSASTEERRVAYFMDSTMPRSAFRVQAGSNLDSSWLPGFDQRFELQRLVQGQRVVGGASTWYTN